MAEETKAVEAQSVFCEVCTKALQRSAALMAETRDYVAYFCSEACYAKWHSEPAPEPAHPAIQEGRDRSKSRDDRLKRIVRQHPLRDEPRADSVEPDEVPGS